MSESIPCPNCGSAQSKIIDSRSSKDTTARRRECLLCASRYSTVEVYKVHGSPNASMKAAVKSAETTLALCKRTLKVLDVGKLQKT